MIKNLWNRTVFCCNYRHEHPIKMNVIQGPASPFYACPKYYPENREEGEPSCMMRLNFVDAEKVLDAFSDIIEKDEAENIYKDYTNYEFNYKQIHVKVIKYSRMGNIKLEIFNRKAVQWKK